jgi:hypothetical protein
MWLLLLVLVGGRKGRGGGKARRPLLLLGEAGGATRKCDGRKESVANAISEIVGKAIYLYIRVYIFICILFLCSQSVGQRTHVLRRRRRFSPHPAPHRPLFPQFGCWRGRIRRENIIYIDFKDLRVFACVCWGEAEKLSNGAINVTTWRMNGQQSMMYVCIFGAAYIRMDIQRLRSP